MSLTSRRVLVILCLVAAGLPAASIRAQQQDPTALSDPLAPPPVPPERRALEAAARIANIADRLAALDKIRTDYPNSPLLDQVEAQMLADVLQMPDPTDSADEVLTRILARIPADATPDVRFVRTAAPVSRLVAKKMLLARSEKLLTEAAQALDLNAFIESNLAAAKREGRPEPDRSTLEETFTRDYVARSHLELGRLLVAKGDVLRAETEFKAAAPHLGPAVSALVTLYIDRGDRAKAESFLLEVIKQTPINPTALTTLVNLYRNEPARAEAVLKDVVTRDPMQAGALRQLARFERMRGDDAAALDHFLKAAALMYLGGPDGEALRTLYAKAHGRTDGLDAAIDALYRALPKPIAAERYAPTAPRTGRLVLLEMFTGSACPPCVAADLAFDAALERYPADLIVPLAYHQHIPGPDPMTTSEGNARRQFYSVSGVPTFFVDGVMAANPDTGQNFGGGPRVRAQTVYEKYVGMIDGALTTAPAATVAVQASLAGEKVNASVDVSQLPADAADLRLHIVLAERELMFGGENGVRRHTMVVRAVAGTDGTGLPLAAAGTTRHTFDLAAIRQDVTRSLQMDIARRRAGGGNPNAVFAAEDRAMTKMDPSQFVVVAFVQGPNKRILQGARADVAAGNTRGDVAK
jgi:tetratricopeptide (TPR) repeat protein